MPLNWFRKRDSEMTEPAWITEGKSVWGLHEQRDKAKLQAWLRSDGPTLGDPTKLPWCGDYVETAIKNALPDEPFEGPMAQNPYWARNWLHFGVATRPCRYSILVFSRGSGGHVGFAVGYADGYYYVLGGNQSNSVNIVRITESRLLGARWPSTVPNPLEPLPKMSPTDIPVSTNEF
jgi:uncharacterized protein (TIGR02594 family)